MRTFMRSSFTKSISVLLILSISAFHVPAEALTPKKSPQEDLKQIQYEYYFRGKYSQAINALHTFLKRDDLDRDLDVSAREYLAASYILSGDRDRGKNQFLHLLNEYEHYAGPDPAIFKPEVVDAFSTTRDALASVKLRSAPDTGAADGTAQAANEETSKPIYKKWWLYVGLAAALVVVAAATSPKEEDPPEGPAQPTGTVTVGVQIR